MSALEFYKGVKDQGGKVALALDYDGTINKLKSTLPPDCVEPEEGCIDAMKMLQGKGDLPFPCSARPLSALLSGFPIDGMSYIANEGHIVMQTDKGVPEEFREVIQGPMPDWTETERRLSSALTLPEGAKLSNEGTAYFCFIEKADPDYAVVQAAFDVEIGILNASLEEKVERIDYGNGVQIAQVKRARKVTGLMDWLRLQNIKWTGSDSYDFGLLFKEHIGALIIFDDSPHAAITQALQWVKNLKDGDGRKVGFAVKVARPGDDLSVVPSYADQHVADQKAVVTMLKEMAAYEPVAKRAGTPVVQIGFGTCVEGLGSL